MNPLILVIGDDCHAHRQLRIAIRKAGPQCAVECAQNREQIQRFHNPSIILLDLLLSREMPLDVLRWLRNDGGYQRTPVFVLGSETLKHEINQAYAIGADACLLEDSTAINLEAIARGIVTYASLRQ